MALLATNEGNLKIYVQSCQLWKKYNDILFSKKMEVYEIENVNLGSQT